MARNLSDYLYRLISLKIKIFEPIHSSIKGEFRKYKTYLTNIPEDHFWYKNFESILPDGRKIKMCYKQDNSMYVKVLDRSKLYSSLIIYISNDGNKVIFNSKTAINNEKKYDEEKSEYKYDARRRVYTSRYTKISSLQNQIMTMYIEYDEHGVETKKEIDSQEIEINLKEKTKTKKVKSEI